MIFAPTHLVKHAVLEKAPPKKPARCGAVLKKNDSSAGVSRLLLTAGAGPTGLGKIVCDLRVP